jgi:hypothetical protein
MMRITDDKHLPYTQLSPNLPGLQMGSVPPIGVLQNKPEQHGVLLEGTQVEFSGKHSAHKQQAQHTSLNSTGN